MNELIKIKDMTGRYSISARTLRYYEDIGLIASMRSDDYAYRLYDDEAVKRLEQILILRKLNISIRDIKRIFSVSGAGVVLEVLQKKVSDIDDEVALLHELKELVLEFIGQIKLADFSKDSDVRQLYKKAENIEIQLANVDYDGNPSDINRLLGVAEKLSEKADVVMKSRFPVFSVCLEAFATDDKTREAFALYEEAFGATKAWEDLPYGLPPGNLHMGMDINGYGFLLKTNPTIAKARKAENVESGMGFGMHFESEDGVKKAYDVLTREGCGDWLEPAPHAPVAAWVVDKFGFGWWIHT